MEGLCVKDPGCGVDSIKYRGFSAKRIGLNGVRKSIGAFLQNCHFPISSQNYFCVGKGVFQARMVHEPGGVHDPQVHGGLGRSGALDIKRRTKILWTEGVCGPLILTTDAEMDGRERVGVVRGGEGRRAQQHGELGGVGRKRCSGGLGSSR